MNHRVREYYLLTKPGILLSNVISAIAGFFFAASWNIQLTTLAATIGGVAFIIASACVANNYIDRNIDAKMKRTKIRATVSGSIPKTNVIVFAVILGVIGFVLISFTNALTFMLGVVAYGTYVAAYGYFKRVSVHGTLVGAIPGALPPVAGYTAVTGNLDASALILFLILGIWQMPHFYAISMFRRDEYKAAGIPVLAVVRGMNIAKKQIIAYVVLLCIVAPLLAVVGEAGHSYFIIAVVSTLTWLYVGIKHWSLPEIKWAKRMFFHSLWVLLVLCFAIATGTMLP